MTRNAGQIAGHESPLRLSVSGVAGGIEVVVSAKIMVVGDRSAHALADYDALHISFAVGCQIQPAVTAVLSASRHVEAVVDGVCSAYPSGFYRFDWQPSCECFTDCICHEPFKVFAELPIG